MNDTQAEKAVEYDSFLSRRQQYAKKFGNIFSLPVGKSPRRFIGEMYHRCYSSGTILDFGCGATKPLQRLLSIDDSHYFSCDSDQSTRLSYHSLEEIPDSQTFDMIVASQVFEHLSFKEAIHAARILGRHVAPGGLFVIDVPNPQHPTRQLSNPTHKTPWSYLDLCILLDIAGLEPHKCFRSNKRAGPRFYEWPIVYVIGRVYRMDWCDTVYAYGYKSK